MRDLMTTVAYIHQNNIIHRDLKLQNICFERRRKNSSEELPPIKIIDFGTSKFLKTEQNETLQTPAGTPLYMAQKSLMIDTTISVMCGHVESLCIFYCQEDHHFVVTPIKMSIIKFNSVR
jgi:serine/threonine protein kinase